MEEIISQHMLQGVLAVVTAILTGAYTRLSKKFKQKDEETEAMKMGVRAVLHLELYKECQLLMEQNRVTTEDLKNVERIYENYHKLGGNGTGTALYERILKLPLDDGKDDDQ